MADVELGIHTNHMVLEHDAHKSEQYLANVALKVNVKLGGKNHMASFRASANSNECLNISVARQRRHAMVPEEENYASWYRCDSRRTGKQSRNAIDRSGCRKRR